MSKTQIRISFGPATLAWLQSEALRMDREVSEHIRILVTELRASQEKRHPAKVAEAKPKRPKINPSGDMWLSPDEAEIAAWIATPTEELSMGWDAWIAAYRDRNKPTPVQPMDDATAYALPVKFYENKFDELPYVVEQE